MPVLEKMDAENDVRLPKPPAPASTSGGDAQRRTQRAELHVLGSLARTFDSDSEEAAERNGQEGEHIGLITATRSMFTSLIEGHSTIMQGHSEIERELSCSHATAGALQARIDAIRTSPNLAAPAIPKRPILSSCMTVKAKMAAITRSVAPHPVPQRIRRPPLPRPPPSRLTPEEPRPQA